MFQYDSWKLGVFDKTITFLWSHVPSLVLVWKMCKFWAFWRQRKHCVPPRPPTSNDSEAFLLTCSAFVMPDRYSIMSSTVSKWNPCRVLFGISAGVSCPSSGGPLVSDLTSNLGSHCPPLETELWGNSLPTGRQEATATLGIQFGYFAPLGCAATTMSQWLHAQKTN